MMLSLLGNEGKRLICKIYLRLGWSMPPTLRAFFIREILFVDCYDTASKAYRPKPYNGRAILILGEHNVDFDPETIWRDLIPNELTSCALPGNHAEILQEPLIGVVAGHFRNCLENAQERHDCRLRVQEG